MHSPSTSNTRGRKMIDIDRSTFSQKLDTTHKLRRYLYIFRYICVFCYQNFGLNNWRTLTSFNYNDVEYSYGCFWIKRLVNPSLHNAYTSHPLHFHSYTLFVYIREVCILHRDDKTILLVSYMYVVELYSKLPSMLLTVVLFIWFTVQIL